jgi:hypothetical protein
MGAGGMNRTARCRGSQPDMQTPTELEKHLYLSIPYTFSFFSSSFFDERRKRDLAVTFINSSSECLLACPVSQPTSQPASQRQSLKCSKKKHK